MSMRDAREHDESGPEITIALKLRRAPRDLAFARHILELCERHMLSEEGETAPQAPDNAPPSGSAETMRRLQDEVTVNAGWLLRTIAQQTLEGVQPRGKALRALFAEQHRVPQPNEGTLGAWVRSISVAAERLGAPKPFVVQYPDSPEAVYSMEEATARAVLGESLPL